jgi:hypothetical protein
MSYSFVQVHTGANHSVRLNSCIGLTEWGLSPELENVRREVEQLTRDASAAIWHQAPPGKWSCALIFEHLLLSYTGTTKGISNIMKAGRPLGSKISLQDRVKTLWVTKLGLMPSGRNAPSFLTPKSGIELDSFRRFYDALVAMDATLADAERRFGSSAKLLDHPFIGPLNAKEWRQFHLAHSRHHLKQAAGRIRQHGPADLVTIVSSK